MGGLVGWGAVGKTIPEMWAEHSNRAMSSPSSCVPWLHLLLTFPPVRPWCVTTRSALVCHHPFGHGVSPRVQSWCVTTRSALVCHHAFSLGVSPRVRPWCATTRSVLACHHAFGHGVSPRIRPECVTTRSAMVCHHAFSTGVSPPVRHWRHHAFALGMLLLKCCFTSTETVGLLGTGAQDGHLDFHTGGGQA